MKFDDVPHCETHCYRTTLDYARQFPSNRARVALGQGLFGWPFVRKLEPLPPAEEAQPN